MFYVQKRKIIQMENVRELPTTCKLKKTSLNFEPLLFMNENAENIDILQRYSLTYPKCHEGTPCPLLADSMRKLNGCLVLKDPVISSFLKDFSSLTCLYENSYKNVILMSNRKIFGK